tara:strand:+ start:182 stop:352 length:171 start_codon:yes stop_codon:yes gene_type:complete
MKKQEATMYKVQVQTGKDTTWSGNALKFETRTKAEAYARDLMSRWLLVTDYRIVKL